MPLQTAAVDQDKLNAFLGRVIDDFGASLSATLVYIGQKLGLYHAMAGAGPVTPAELAKLTGTNERYIREWLLNQAAGGYVAYDPTTEQYHLPPEQAMALTDQESPAYVAGGFFVIKAMMQAAPRIEEAFRKGGGMLWHEHDPDLFIGTERFFRPGYQAHLVKEWIPALSGIDEKLSTGGTAVDVGCGHGMSTIIMAQAYPLSRFYGFDDHEPSIKRAQQLAIAAGVADRVTFNVSPAERIPDHQFDMVTFFDCLHDMGDPVGACRRAFEVLKPEGSVLIVEPMAGNRIEENFNPVGRTYSGASVLCCTANSMALGGPALGAVATDDAIRQVVTAGGFTQFRRVAETPFNRIFEARR